LQFRPVDLRDGHDLHSPRRTHHSTVRHGGHLVLTPAASGLAVAGIPPLGGNATDLKTAPEIPASTGQPPTQLLTQNIVTGTGPTAKPTDTVNVRYVGALYDGTPFDSSWSRGDTPISFPLNQVVPCRIPELGHVPLPAVSSCWFVSLIRSRRCSSLQLRPVNTFSAPTGVAAAKSACATSFTGAPAQMVQFVDGSGLDANVVC
jgi:hypothetical protein